MALTFSPWDLTINGTGFMLARQRQADGSERRLVERTKLDKPVYQQNPGDVQAGAGPNEVIIELIPQQNAHWGEGRRMAPGGYAFGTNVEVHDGQVTLAPLLTSANTSVGTAGAAPRGFFEISGNSTEVYLLWGRYIVAITAATPGTNRNSRDLGVGDEATQAANFDGYVHVTNYTTSSGAAANLERLAYSGGADSWGTPGASTDYDGICQAPHSTGSVMYGTRYVSSLTRMDKVPSGSSAISSASWTDNINIGDAGERYRWLVNLNYQIYAMSPVGVWAYDENLNSVNLLPMLKNYRNADNGKQALVWNQSIWIPTIRGLYATDGREVVEVNPVSGHTLRQDNNSRRFGYPTALAATERELIVVTWNGTDSYVLKGSDATGQMVWNTWLYISGQGPFTCAHITGLTDPPRLFLGQQAATGFVYWAALPRADNPLQDPQALAASGSFYTGYHTAGLPNVNATAEEFRVAGDSLSSDETVTLNYRMTPTAAFTAISGAISSTLSIKTLTSSNAGEGVEVRADLARGSTNTNTPVLRSLQAVLLKRPRQAQLWRMTIDCSDQQDRHGLARTETARSLLDVLTGLEDDTTPFTFTDPDNGDSKTGLLLGKVDVQEVGQTDVGTPIYWVTCLIREVAGT